MRKEPGNRRTLRSILVLMALLSLTRVALAETNGHVPAATGGPYELQPTRIAGGARTVLGGTFSMVGTVGQHDAQVVSAQGGGYEVAGGFHPAASANPVAPPVELIFGNGFE